MQTIKVALGQIESHEGQIDSNLKTHINYILRAGQEGVDVLVFPELSLSSYIRQGVKEYTFTTDDKRLACFQKLADSHKMTIIIGLPYVYKDKIYIASFIYQPNKSLEIYMKNYLHEGEEGYYTCGKDLKYIEVKGYKLALSICYDIENDQHFHDVKDADLYISSIFYSPKGMEGLETRAKIMADKFDMQLMISNYSGHVYGIESGGQSMIVSPGQIDKIEIDKGLLIGQYNGLEWTSESILIKANRQSDLIAFLVNKLSVLEGIEAIFLKGSLASNTDDDYSDVDFYCKVKADSYEKFLAMREDILSSYKAVVYKSFVNFKHPQIIVIYDNNLHLDFYLVTDVEEEGVDDIKVLYDPKDVFHSYKKIKRHDINLSNYLSDVIYTIHELDIAIKRGDKLWAMCLLSHMMADMSLVLAGVYDDKKPVLHMKGVYQIIPEDIKKMIDDILDQMCPRNLIQTTKDVIKLLDAIMSLDQVDCDNIDTRYLAYMKKNMLGE